MLIIFLDFYLTQSIYIIHNLLLAFCGGSDRHTIRVLPVKVLTVLTTCMRHCHIQVFVTHTKNAPS